MGIIIDAIVIGFIVLSTFLAYRKGFVKLAVHMCAFIIAIVLTFILSQPISNLIINGTNIDETIENTIYEKANEIMEENNKNEITNEVIQKAQNEMLPETSRDLAINIVKGGVQIILFIAIRIALIFVTAIANAISKIPILNQINKAGGIAYGILRGIIIVYAILLLLNISAEINPENKINTSINESYVTKTMYENNILNILF